MTPEECQAVTIDGRRLDGLTREDLILLVVDLATERDMVVALLPAVSHGMARIRYQLDPRLSHEEWREMKGMPAKEPL